MADVNSNTSSDLAAEGATHPEGQREGGEPTPVAGSTMDPGDQLDTDSAEYAKLLDFYDSSFRNIAEGEVVKGTVLKVTDSEVIVDVGYKSEGIIGVQEFLDETGQVTVQAGDIVDVLLERTEDRDGYVVLSREKAEKMKIWDDVEKAFADKKVVIGRVIERIKGGLAVDIGVRAFLPGSQVDVRPVRNLDALRGQELRMRVIKVNKKRGNIVLSRKVLLEEENAEKKKHTLETLADGKVLRGVVKNITDYGAFIDLGGIDGLLHITDMSWGRVGHPSELFKVNDTVEALVLGLDPQARRISLGLKQIGSNPWQELAERYPVGSKIVGKVRNLTEFGAFVEVEEDIDGLIHISDMSWSKRVKHPSEVLKKGDKVEAVVLNIDAENQRLSLGLKQLATDIWDEFFSRHQVGDTVEGKVVRLTNFGAFVELAEGIEGLIHVSEFDDTQGGGEKIELAVEQTYPMKIIKLSPGERKIGLSIRALRLDQDRQDWQHYADGGSVGATIAEHLKNLQ
jgi:small subunit ribosomal protein S1